MRAAVAILSAVLVLAGAAAPHHHAGARGTHGCVACVTRGAEPARDETPRLTPRTAWVQAVQAEPEGVLATGAPLGAIPGQSPPLA
jgi:hypothetical protein